MFSENEAKRYPALSEVLSKPDPTSRRHALDRNEMAVMFEIESILRGGESEPIQQSVLAVLLENASDLKLYQQWAFTDSRSYFPSGKLNNAFNDLYCHYASGNPRIDVMAHMEKAGLAGDPAVKNRALMRCMQHYDGGPVHREIAENLIAQGANVDMEEGVLLSHAVTLRNERAAQFLLNAGAQTDVRNHAPIVHAVRNDDPGMVRLLLKHGANKNEGLLAAAAAKSPKMLKGLLAAGANPNHIGQSGRCVMDNAMSWVGEASGDLRKNREDGLACAKLLLEHGAHPFSVGALVAKRYLKGAELQAAMTQRKEDITETIALLKTRGRSFVRGMAERLIEMTKEPDAAQRTTFSAAPKRELETMGEGASPARPRMR